MSSNRWQEVRALLVWILTSWRRPASSETGWEQSEREQPWRRKIRRHGEER